MDIFPGISVGVGTAALQKAQAGGWGVGADAALFIRATCEVEVVIRQLPRTKEEGRETLPRERVRVPGIPVTLVQFLAITGRKLEPKEIAGFVTSEELTEGRERFPHLF